VRIGQEAELTVYLHCPRCGLAIRTRAGYLTLERCPRCLGRAGIVTRMFASPLNAGELRAADLEADEVGTRPQPGDLTGGM
jgi:hypothetical protein